MIDQTRPIGSPNKRETNDVYAPVVPAHPGALCPGSLHPDCRGVAAIVEDGHRPRVVVVGSRLRQVVGVGSTVGGGGGKVNKISSRHFASTHTYALVSSD